MSKPPDLQHVRDHKSAVRFAKSHGWRVYHGGRHDIASNERGACALPRHKGDYCRGTAHSIRKTFVLMLALMAVCAIALVGVV